MRKIAALALAALAACSSDKKDPPIQYGAPRAPTANEQSAITNAEMMLESSLAYQGSTEPTAGAAGLGDELALELGGKSVSVKPTVAPPTKLAQAALRQAFDTGGLDPNCVHPATVGSVTTVTWGSPGAPCEIVVSQPPDPVTGDSMSMTVHIAGWLTWDAAASKTTWDIGEEVWLTMVSGGQTITEHGTAGLQGSMTVTATTIVAGTSSTVDVTATYMGLTMSAAMGTTLAADLDYQASPFCITGGTLTVEQRWTKRPTGQTSQTLPNQGWRFDWTGCGAFTVAPGT